MEDTTRALAIADSNPKDDINGVIRDAVVISATVDDPWAVFKAAAMIKGSQIPRLAFDREVLRTSASGEFRRTVPNDPPAPVIIIIMAEPIRDCPTQPVVDNICISSFFGSRKARSVPIINAMTGSPIKLTTFLKLPCPNGCVGKSEIDFTTIRNIGNIIGVNALNAGGASLSWASISASDSSGLGSI